MFIESTLVKRILTAIILIPLTLAGLFFLSPPWFCFFTWLITLGAAWEWTNLMALHSPLGKIFYLVASAIVFYFTLFLPISIVFTCAFVWWLLAVLLVVLYPRASQRWNKGFVIRGVMGWLVLAPCWTAINFMRNQRDGIYTLLFLFVLIWGADSAAYFAGKKWGKTRLAPLVSPGKTIQGCMGALIFSVIIVFTTLWFCDIPFSIWPWAVILSLVTVIFSIVGDLFESMMKREVKLKDSGRLLPGHGGLLDRIDSLTAAAPIFVLGGLLLGKYLN